MANSKRRRKSSIFRVCAFAPGILFCRPQGSGMLIRRPHRTTPSFLATHRAAVWIEVGDWARADLEPQVAVWTAFSPRSAQRDVRWLHRRARWTCRRQRCGTHTREHSAPRFASDRAGRVQSVYVDPNARHQGVARAIMQYILDFARSAQLISLSLHPSDPARSLYAALGFEAADEMTLRLAPG